MIRADENKITRKEVAKFLDDEDLSRDERLCMSMVALMADISASLAMIADSLSQNGGAE